MGERFMYPKVVYHGSADPEITPQLFKGDCLYTTPDFDDALGYAENQVNPPEYPASLNMPRHKPKPKAYVFEFRVADGLTILNTNRNPKIPRILERYLGRAIRSKEDFEEQLFHVLEWSPIKFIRLLKTLNYDGFNENRPDAIYFLCFFDLSDLVLSRRFTVRMGSKGQLIVE